MKKIIKSVPKDFKKSVADPEGMERYKQLTIPVIPTRAVFEIMRLQREIVPNLKKISNPIIALHGKNDRVSPIFNLDILRRGVSSRIFETRIFKNSRHVLTLDSDKETVSKAVVEFFQKFE